MWYFYEECVLDSDKPQGANAMGTDCFCLPSSGRREGLAIGWMELKTKPTITSIAMCFYLSNVVRVSWYGAVEWGRLGERCDGLFCAIVLEAILSKQKKNCMMGPAHGGQGEEKRIYIRVHSYVMKIDLFGRITTIVHIRLYYVSMVLPLNCWLQFRVTMTSRPVATHGHSPSIDRNFVTW
jgi:hypothetical protein